jgi:predicted short-subunit dehydrogenase-like oxidoreductase (DUF2520 family)
MNVTFIGSGNLAWHLAPALDNTDFPVREVYSVNPKHAEALVEKLYEAHVAFSLDFSLSKSRIFIISVSDDAITDVAQQLILPPDSIVMHTSGSQPLSVLGYIGSANIGVLYPLQTFTKTKRVDFKEIPMLIESDNAETEKVLVSLAKSISKKVIKISSANRKAIHVAAVFASNFTNHMLTISKSIVEKQKLDFDLLKPLIVETINKSLGIGPDNAQTGPAKRGDLEILDNHMQFLSDDERIAEIYQVISQHIVDLYNEED